MSKGLIMLILITSIELFSATVYYYHDGVSNQSSSYTIYNQDYIEEQDIARWRSDETLHIDWVIEGAPLWFDNTSINPDSFIEEDIEDILWGAAYSWYWALPYVPTYLYDFEYGIHDNAWNCNGDADFQFVFDNSTAESLGLHPYENGVLAGCAIETSTSRSERSITNASIYVSGHPAFFIDYFWKKNSSSTSPGLTGQPLSTVITHEMGHLLGVGHISGEAARMNSNGGTTDCTTDINSWDDRACWELYNINPTNIENNMINSKNCFLSTNHPNPFNPTTTISYSLADNIKNPKIEIYNPRGQKVKNFNVEETPGENSVVWDGKDADNKQVSSGVYFYRLVNEGKTVQSRKMLMLK